MNSRFAKLRDCFLGLLLGFYFLAPNFLLGVVGDIKAGKAFTHSLALIDNPFHYSSYYSDTESRLGYLKARYYSPKLARFISRDTYDLSNKYTPIP